MLDSMHRRSVGEYVHERKLSCDATVISHKYDNHVTTYIQKLVGQINTCSQYIVNPMSTSSHNWIVMGLSAVI